MIRRIGWERRKREDKKSGLDKENRIRKDVEDRDGEKMIVEQMEKRGKWRANIRY